MPPTARLHHLAIHPGCCFLGLRAVPAAMGLGRLSPLPCKLPTCLGLGEASFPLRSGRFPGSSFLHVQSNQQPPPRAPPKCPQETCHLPSVLGSLPHLVAHPPNTISPSPFQSLQKSRVAFLVFVRHSGFCSILGRLVWGRPPTFLSRAVRCQEGKDVGAAISTNPLITTTAHQNSCCVES